MLQHRLLTREEIVELLESLGYTVKLSKDKHYTANNYRFGIKLNFIKHSDQITMQRFNQKTRWISGIQPNKKCTIDTDSYIMYVLVRENYNSFVKHLIWDTPITENLIPYIIRMRGKMIGISIDDLPPPFPYRTDVFYRDGDMLKCHKILSGAKVRDLCSINDNLKISSDINHQQPWYIIEANIVGGYKFEFITTDSGWYPLNRITKKVTTHMRFKNIDLTSISVVDYELVKLAIRDYNSKL